MGAALDRVLVVDVEATCWETKEEQGSQPNEVIEIGICELYLKTNRIENISSYIIRPEFTKVSEFCTKLTGWKQEDVDAGGSIADTLLEITKDYRISKNHVWFSCGEYDRVKLASTDEPGSLGQLYGIKREMNPFALMRAHVNIKTLFALKHRLQREKGMAAMLSMIGETLEGRHHNGADDAANIAKIVRHILSV